MISDRLLQNQARHVLQQYLDAEGDLPILILNSKMHLEEWNAAFSKLLELEHADAGRSFDDYLPPESRRHVSGISAGQRMAGTLHLHTNSGKVRVVQAIIYPCDSNYIVFAQRLSIPDEDVLRRMTDMNHELGSLTRQLTQQKRELEDAHSRIKTLQGMLPICASCKKIRDDQGYWQHIETYVEDHSEAEFTHGICPDCMKERYPEIDARRAAAESKDAPST